MRVKFDWLGHWILVVFGRGSGQGRIEGICQYVLSGFCKEIKTALK